MDKEPDAKRKKYDIMHFEALGPEAQHLERETAQSVKAGALPKNHKYLITHLSLNEYINVNPGAELPGIISIKTHSKIPGGFIWAGKQKPGSLKRKSIITRSAGYDHVEHLAGVANVASLRDYCAEAVAQTAMKFIYACAGRLNHYAANTQNFDRMGSDAFMELGPGRVVTVFGVGNIGRRICGIARANGLEVQGVDLRQGEIAKELVGQVKFVSKEEAVRSSDIIVNAMNLTRDKSSRFYNAGYFSEELLSQAKDGLIFINVTRGEIAPESALLGLYRSGKIGGLGLDVFSNEEEFSRAMRGGAFSPDKDVIAARELVEMSLARTGNIYVQPHQGFNSDIAARAKAREAIRHAEAHFRNKGKRFDEQLPYY